MNFKKIISLFFLFLLIGCKQVDVDKEKKVTIKPEIHKKNDTLKKITNLEEDNLKFIFDRDYRNQGFAFIYDDNLYNEKKNIKKNR